MRVMVSEGSDSTAPEELHTERSAVQKEPEYRTKGVPLTGLEAQSSEKQSVTEALWAF